MAGKGRERAAGPLCNAGREAGMVEYQVFRAAPAREPFRPAVPGSSSADDSHLGNRFSSRRS